MKRASRVRCGCAVICELVIRGGQRPTQPPTYTHTHLTKPPRGGLAACRTQPSSLAVSRLTVNAVKDLNGGASLGFLGQELRPVGEVVAGRPGRLLTGWRLGARRSAPRLEQAHHLRRCSSKHFEHTRDHVVAFGCGRRVLSRHIDALGGRGVGKGGVRPKILTSDLIWSRTTRSSARY